MGRSIKRWFWWIVLTIWGFVAAWLACNGPWADIAPRQPSVDIRPLDPAVAPRNAFFMALGLGAEEGADPAAVGLAVWQGEIEVPAGNQAPGGEVFPCDPRVRNCVADWRRARTEIVAARRQNMGFIERCDRLAAAPPWTEPRLEPWQVTVDKLEPLNFKGLRACLRWWQLDAVLASNATLAAPMLARADGLVRQILSGSHSLLPRAYAWALVRDNVLVASQLALGGDAWRSAVGAMATPLPERLAETDWLRDEAERSTFRTMATLRLDEEAGVTGRCLIGNGPPDRCRIWVLQHAPGLLPQQTRFDLYESFAHMRRGAPRATCEVARAELARSERLARDAWSQLHFRNTIGRWLAASARPDWAKYLAKQSDATLAPLALGVALKLSPLDAVARRAYLDSTELPPVLRGRLNLEPDALVLRTCESEWPENPAKQLRFALPPA